MQRSSTAETRKSLVLSFIVLGLLAALILVPYQFRSEAVTNVNSDKKGLSVRTESHKSGLENYDIRTQKTEETGEALLKFRQESGKSASAIADVRDSFVRGEDNLRTSVKTLKIGYNQDLRVPEVISPDAWVDNVETLSPAASGKRSEVLRSFIKQNNSLIGLNQGQIDSLRVVADYENPAGNIAYAHLEQYINDVPVFRGEVKAGFRKDGSIIRIINNLAPGLDYESLSSDFGNPADAVRAPAKNINYKLERSDVTVNSAASNDLKVVFGNGDWATTAEKMYFPTEIGVARPAWRVLIWLPVNAFYVIVDANTGTVLWRKNLTEDQS